MKKFYITSPIFYPNASLHVGHAYTVTVCDILARAQKLQGKETYFLSGSDQNTSKILKDLENGVLMYPGSAMPGKGGTVIVGHSSSNSPWNKYSNVFSLLNRLQVGDLIYISHNDKNYVYTVSNKKS